MSRIIVGDALETLRTLDAESVQCCVTSPPYFGLRDYGVAGQLGLEKTPAEYVEKMVAVFREVRRVLRNDGTLWLNIGDSFANDGKWGGSSGGKHVTALHGNTGIGRQKVTTGLKPKDLIGIPWMLAFALRADGWYLRQDIIWHKPNPMPESVTDRCTKAHEYVFLLTKSSRYYYDSEAVAEPLASDPTSWGRHSKKDPGASAVVARSMFGPERGGRDGTEFGNGESRNLRSVWTITTTPYKEAHFAVMPPKLVEPCIKAGTSPQACEKCGSPWERKVERGEVVEHPSRLNRQDDALQFHKEDGEYGEGGSLGRMRIKTDRGFSATCKCENEGTGNCVVLDPFSGAGTVGLVTSRLGREYIGIELNPEYVLMSERRIHDDAPLFSEGVA